MKNKDNLFEGKFILCDEKERMIENLTTSIYKDLDFKNKLKTPEQYNEFSFKRSIFYKIKNKINDIFEDITEVETYDNILKKLVWKKNKTEELRDNILICIYEQHKNNSFECFEDLESNEEFESKIRKLFRVLFSNNDFEYIFS